VNPIEPLASALWLPGLLVTLGYLGTCFVWPFKACRVCQGHGQIVGPFRGIRLCGYCAGTGLRLRLGRRLINAAGRLYRDIRDIDRYRG
jgi:hypothetical protein